MERCQLFNNVLTYTHVQASVCIFKHGGFGLKGTALSHTRVLLEGCLCFVWLCLCSVLLTCQRWRANVDDDIIRFLSALNRTFLVLCGRVVEGC